MHLCVRLADQALLVCVRFERLLQLPGRKAAAGYRWQVPGGL